MRDLTEANRKLHAAADKAAADVKDRDAQLAQAAAQAAQVADLKQKLADDDARLAQAGGQDSQIADLRQKLADSQKAAAQQAQSVADLTAANQQLDLDKKAAHAAADKAAADIKDRDAQLAQASAQAAQVADLKQKLADNQRAAAQTSAELRDRDSRLEQAAQENAAVNQRLRQAQGTLDQILAAARLINGGPAPAVPAAQGGGATARLAQAAPSTGQTYVVQEDDSLSSISLRFYGTALRWQDIYDANRDILKGESILHPGQKLRIP